ncbi:MAG: ABC transporter ATP-binding protein [Arenicellales bacterium]
MTNQQDRDTLGPAKSGITIANYSHVFQLTHGDDIRLIEVLRDVSLDVSTGQFVSIVGPSGCGKTTLLNVLAGLEKAQTGEVHLDDAAPRAGRPDIAYMFARPALLPWRTVLDNAAFGMEVREIARADRYAKAHDLLKRVNLAGFEHAYPSQLSQGMRQRVALARTFALDCKYLLMDEPFGALDAQTKLQLEQQLLELYDASPHSTIVFVTHDLGEAIVLSDRVAVMTDRPGTISVDIPISLERPRSVSALQASTAYHELYRELWGALAQRPLDKIVEE